MTNASAPSSHPASKAQAHLGLALKRLSRWHAHGARPARGFTLIDLLVMIVLLGIVSGAMTVLFTRLAAQSSDTLRTRQVLGVAQALLNEVRMMPFTFCDPEDPQARTATAAFAGSGGCLTMTGEGRTATAVTPPSARFDNVSDYHNFAQPNARCAGLCDIAGNLINGPGSTLQDCRSLITTNPQAMPLVAATDGFGLPQALRITVRVSCPHLTDVVLESIRMRYAPTPP